jgi:spore coat protein U-like protein
MRRQFIHAAALLLGAVLSFNTCAQATLAVSATGQYDGDCQNPQRDRARADGQPLRHHPRRTESLYGRIPRKQNVGAGVYADTVVVTVSF